MSIYEASITNPKKQLEFYKDLSEQLQQENKQLKKQLEEYQLQNVDLRADIMIQKMAFPNELIKDKTFYDLYDIPSYEELLVQQKEFIKWLEDYLNLLDCRDIQEQAGYDMLEEILQKYREIIGASNEIVKYIEDLEQQVEKQQEVINNFLDIVDKSKMLLNNPDLLDLYLKMKEVSE